MARPKRRPPGDWRRRCTRLDDAVAVPDPEACCSSSDSPLPRWRSHLGLVLGDFDHGEEGRAPLARIECLDVVPPHFNGPRVVRGRVRTARRARPAVARCRRRSGRTLGHPAESVVDNSRCTCSASAVRHHALRLRIEQRVSQGQGQPFVDIDKLRQILRLPTGWAGGAIAPRRSSRPGQGAAGSRRCRS
jgi:hypothetical protein